MHLPVYNISIFLTCLGHTSALYDFGCCPAVGPHTDTEKWSTVCVIRKLMLTYVMKGEEIGKLSNSPLHVWCCLTRTWRYKIYRVGPRVNWVYWKIPRTIFVPLITSLPSSYFHDFFRNDNTCHTSLAIQDNILQMQIFHGTRLIKSPLFWGVVVHKLVEKWIRK